MLFRVFQRISEGPSAYEYLFNFDGDPISSSWGISTLYPEQQCLNSNSQKDLQAELI